MDLPASISCLEEQIRGDSEIVPDPALFSDPQVFAAERERIFQRSVVALDHETRLSGRSRWFRCDAGPRSILVTKDSGGSLRALRNVCLHAGYPVCDAQEGTGERLMCPYHGWEYSLDGRLVEPELSSRIDPSRLRLPSYPIRIVNGLMFLDPAGGTADEAKSDNSVPPSLMNATVTRRARYNTKRNWKLLRHFVLSSPSLFLDDSVDDCRELGPLSFLLMQQGRGILLRIVPRFAEQTDFEVIEMTAGESPSGAQPGIGADTVAERLQGAGASVSWFDRNMARWYWSLISAGE